MAEGRSETSTVAVGYVGFQRLWWQQHRAHIRERPLMTPNLPPVTITGIGSVSPYGPLAGLIPQCPLEPSAITDWTSAGLRRAFLVPPFRPASVVPGLKTRRLDRLSAWALVASSLALKDAGIDLRQVERSRGAG